MPVASTVGAAAELVLSTLARAEISQHGSARRRCRRCTYTGRRRGARDGGAQDQHELGRQRAQGAALHRGAQRGRAAVVDQPCQRPCRQARPRREAGTEQTKDEDFTEFQRVRESHLSTTPSRAHALPPPTIPPNCRSPRLKRRGRSDDGSRSWRPTSGRLSRSVIAYVEAPLLRRQPTNVLEHIGGQLGGGFRRRRRQQRRRRRLERRRRRRHRRRLDGRSERARRRRGGHEDGHDGRARAVRVCGTGT